MEEPKKITEPKKIEPVEEEEESSSDENNNNSDTSDGNESSESDEESSSSNASSENSSENSHEKKKEENVQIQPSEKQLKESTTTSSQLNLERKSCVVPFDDKQMKKEISSTTIDLIKEKLKCSRCHEFTCRPWYFPPHNKDFFCCKCIACLRLERIQLAARALVEKRDQDYSLEPIKSIPIPVFSGELLLECGILQELFPFSSLSENDRSCFLCRATPSQWNNQEIEKHKDCFMRTEDYFCPFDEGATCKLKIYTTLTDLSENLKQHLSKCIAKIECEKCKNYSSSTSTLFTVKDFPQHLASHEQFDKIILHLDNNHLISKLFIFFMQLDKAHQTIFLDCFS